MFTLIELDGIVWKLNDETGQTWLYDSDDNAAGWVEIKDKPTTNEEN